MTEKRPTPAAVLCYHSYRREADSYNKNDFIALGEDLDNIKELGIPVSSALNIAQALQGHIPWENVAGSIAITFDDGAILDYCDFITSSGKEYPALYQHLTRHNAPATSFVIASPNARHILETKSLNGEAMLSEHWWSPATAGLIDVGNHSWDHNHTDLPWPHPMHVKKGSFFEIKTEESADWEVSLAQTYIKNSSGREPKLFAYPYGDVSEYLRDEYFPARAEKIGLLGAFSTGGQLVTPTTCRWEIPRFVCGNHWKHPSGLIELVLDKIRKHQ